MLSVVTDYVVALQIAKASSATRRIWLAVSLLINFGLLFYFKYLYFFAENAVGLLSLMRIDVELRFIEIILPLGISFYTFQTISYTVDVYRGFIKPEKDFVLYGCYVTFFPQLVAGPILRAVEVIPQFSCPSRFKWQHIENGLKRILYGLFLKVVLADNIAPLVDQGYSVPVHLLSALDVWTLAFLFGLQIYFDFCAYSHIALGSARLVGIQFPENFNFPYLAVSPQDFWRRWHISLSSWIRDYVYLPLTGAKVQDRSVGGLATAIVGNRKTAALFATWAIMGLWHGANWTFVVWGLYHATWIALYRLVSPLFSSLSRGIRNIGGWLITLPLAMLGWIAFRSETIENTFQMLRKVFIPSEYLWLGMRENTYIVTALLTIGVIGTYFFQKQLIPVLKQTPILFATSQSLFFAGVIVLVFVFLRPINQFIYFQF